MSAVCQACASISYRLLNSLNNPMQYSPHFTDVEIKTLRVSDLPKVTKVVWCWI